MHITSRDNSLLRQARAVRDGKDDELIFVEGLRLCVEALRSNLQLEAVVVSEELIPKEKAAEAIADLSKASRRVATVSEKLLESISYTRTPQGIVVLARRPEASQQRLEASSTNQALLVLLHQINNPVNVGAILRTAEAAGATGIITTKNTSDPFSPKSLRGAMGSAFRLPIWRNTDFAEAVAWCRTRNIELVGTDAQSSLTHTDWDWTRASALVLGPESTGLTDDELKATDQTVSIPMQGAVESLNVSVAAGILLYEAARQRYAPVSAPA
jgi:TrmH family RNA methyltransferase